MLLIDHLSSAHLSDQMQHKDVSDLSDFVDTMAAFCILTAFGLNILSPWSYYWIVGCFAAKVLIERIMIAMCIADWYERPLLLVISYFTLLASMVIHSLAEYLSTKDKLERPGFVFVCWTLMLLQSAGSILVSRFPGAIGLTVVGTTYC
jgi:hypothetical protein